MPLLICNHLRDKETTKDFQLGSQHDGTRPARRPGGLPPGLDRSGRPSKGRERGARGGREALGSRAAAVCVRRRGWRIFSSFSCQGPSSPAIGGSTFWCLLLYEAATKVTVDNGGVREGGFGVASVYSIAIAASRPNCWRTLSRSGQSFFSDDDD